MIKIKNADTVSHTWVGQEILAGEYYTLQPVDYLPWANDSQLLTDISSGIAIVNNGSDDITNIAQGINYLIGKAPSDVITAMEKDDKGLRLSCIQNTFTGNQCLLEIQIPGTPGPNPGRFISDGYCFTNVFYWGDKVSKIELVDKDAVYAPADTVLGVFHDDEVLTANQGNLFWAEEGGHGGIDVEPLGGYGNLPAGAYLRVTIDKDGASPATKAALNIYWGVQN